MLLLCCAGWLTIDWYCAVQSVVVVVPFGTHLDTVDDYCDFVFVSLSRAAAPAAVEFEFEFEFAVLSAVHCSSPSSFEAYYRCTRREFGSTQQTQQQQQLFRL